MAARFCGPRGTSLILSDANIAACRFYERASYAVRARRPMVREGWTGAGAEWLLMVKP